NAVLLDAAEALDGVRLFFDRRCVDADVEAPSATFIDPQSGRQSSATGDALLGADGAFSAIRLQLQRQEGFNYQQAYLEHGYKELLIPPARGGGFLLEKHALHIWPRGGWMLIALPNFDGSFTCTCFWPLQGTNSF